MIPEYCKKLIRLLNSNGYEAYVVGGAVRDILMEKTPHDYDVATSATPDETKKVLEDSGIRTIIENGVKHGTVTGIIDDHLMEITSYRVESGYTDSRRPDSVVFTRSIEEDVRRRDFTINAMYLDSESNIVDLTGGREDIKNQIIRAVGNPYERFNEDALRILRALRFASRLGFKIEEETSKAMHELRNNLKLISAERIHSELTGILTHQYAVDVIREFHDVFEVLIPELEATIGFDQMSKYHHLDVFEHMLAVLGGIPLNADGCRDEALSYAAFFHDIGKPVVFYIGEDGRGHMVHHQDASEKIAREFCTRLKFSTKLTKDISNLILLHDSFPKLQEIVINKFIAKYSLEFCERLYVIQRADILAHSPVGLKRMDTLEAIIRTKNNLVNNNACFSLKDLMVNGNDLKAAGITDGRRIGGVLNRLLEAVIEKRIVNEYDALIQYALKL